MPRRLIDLLSLGLAGLLASLAGGCGNATAPPSETLVEPGPVDAVSDRALFFDGVDDYASLGTARVPAMQRDQSALLWFRAETDAATLDGLQALFTLRRGDESGWAIVLEQGVPQAFGIYAARSLVRANAAVTTGAWHHLAFVIAAADGCRLYVDGLEVGADDLPATKRTPTHAYLGSLDGYAGSFHGSVDELRLYDRALSADEVARAAAGGARDPEADADSLVMYLSFNEVGGARSFDRSGLGNHAELGDGVPGLMPARVASGIPE